MKKIDFIQNSKIFGGATYGRCMAMASRWQRRGGGETRLKARIEKNCSGTIWF